jgi:putative oxidoreductase
MIQMKSHWLDAGLLVLRLGIGTMFIVHGAPKLLDGPDRWERLGESMTNLGISFAPTFWGFMAAVSECVGGALMILGIVFRQAMAFMLVTMAVATVHHFAGGDSIGRASHAIEAGFVFLSLLIIGPGRYTVPYALRRRQVGVA